MAVRINHMNAKWILVAGGVAVAAVAAAAWFVFSPASGTPANQTQELGTGGERDISTNDQPLDTLGASNQSVSANQKIFKISDGPVAGATLIQTLRPTTTIARFVSANRGHVSDLALDSPGAVPRAVSNTTIPGVARVLWSAKGNGALLQYVEDETVKTVSLSNMSTTTQSIKVQFLPNNIQDAAVSPEGSQIVYLLHAQAGSDGYLAKTDGGGAKKLFYLPLSRVLLSWPSGGNILAYSAPSAGAPGIAFSVAVQSGAVSPILFAPGLTAAANRDFSKIIYQTNAGERSTYIYDVKSGLSTGISLDPYPEKCTANAVYSTRLYCATPLSYVDAGYLDLWHMGAASAEDGIVSYDLSTGRSAIVAAPGSADGGASSDIAEMAVSPDDKYLLFIRKGDRSLWGVRL